MAATSRYGGAMIVRCTRRALTLLGGPSLDDRPASEGDWYLNLLWLDRRKCLLLTHADTLFAVLIPDVHAAQLRPPARCSFGPCRPSCAPNSFRPTRSARSTPGRSCPPRPQAEASSAS
jgi:hypothetical protein